MIKYPDFHEILLSFVDFNQFFGQMNLMNFF